ncbi:enoyl-CoA hydratase [Frigidibacter sp. ROC022]|uniref:enoyl-CoA hydratase n=1 Tax=Frigidibacter sp. ROC022 TaxID=2971796 RepID=UPI00215AF330|nr:enoyl-CoA hydratase [Frigidibacter sp. ROC022]MCR8723823.1 enoyl-CoA hydratase [Frigidibacter sp. ROC022]
MILKRQDRDGVARLVLNAPERLNALSDAMLLALQTTLDTIAGESGIRVVVIAAEGRTFCAGHDLTEIRAARAAPDKGAAKLADLFTRCARVMTTIRDMPQPVIAEVGGLATAAGCQLVAACDLAIAADTARFGVNGVNIGLFCSTPMVALTRNVGRKQAFEMLVTGRFLNADEAVAAGLVNRAVHADRLQEEVLGLAETITAKLGAAVRIGKRAFHAQAEMGLDDAYAYAGEVMVENMMDEGTAEGIAAFLEKRKPDWAAD